MAEFVIYSMLLSIGALGIGCALGLMAEGRKVKR